MILSILLFLLGLFLLCKGGDLFVDAAVALARRFHLSEILIGATIVSMGTTIPEMAVSTIASAGGFSDIAYGNALGSVICNTALIAGMLLLLAPSVVRKRDIRLGAAFFFGAGLIFFLLAFGAGGIGRAAGAVLLGVLIVYLAANARAAAQVRETSGVLKTETEAPLYRTIFPLVAGAAMIFLGSNLLVNNGVLITHAVGVPERVIALTFIALGTSLPELVTAIAAICKGHGGVSLGNIIGANIINVTGVIGMASVIAPVKIPANLLIIDCTLALITMLMLIAPIARRGKTSRLQGFLLISVYAFYCFALFRGGIALNAANVFAPYMILH